MIYELWYANRIPKYVNTFSIIKVNYQYILEGYTGLFKYPIALSSSKEELQVYADLRNIIIK